MERLAPKGILLVAAVICGGSFAFYYSHGLSTVHYDAKAHLVIARRMIDGPVPGYAQMGAHWLPLIHLLYLPFVVLDSQYHSAFLPCIISVLSFIVSCWMAYRIALRMSGSVLAGVFAALTLLANRNLLFLQSAPLTEPVFMALILLALDGFLRWRDGGGPGTPWLPATWMALACLCRYEGWLFLGGTVAVVLYDGWKGRMPRPGAAKAAAAYLGAFLVPLALHFGYIFWRLGDSFFQRVARGNPAPIETYHRPFLAAWYHFGEVTQAAGVVPLLIALGGLAYFLSDRKNLERRLPYLLLWTPSLVNMAALYWGLMYRVRYSSLLVPAVAVFGSLAVSREDIGRRVAITSCLAVFLLPWISWAFPGRWEYNFVYPGAGIVLLPAAALLLLLAALSRGCFRAALVGLVIAGLLLPVFAGEERAMLVEASEHGYLDGEQREVLGYLRSHYDGSRILIDVGMLAPLMYDSRLPIREFVYHDGDLSDWDRASVKPLGHVGWLCAQKGDEIWGLLHVDPHWADGYSLAVATANYVLYRANREGGKAPPSTGHAQ